MDYQRSRLAMLLSLESPVSSPVSKYFPSKISLSPSRLIKHEQNTPNNTKNQNSLKFLKLAPITSFNQTNENTSTQQISIRRNHHLQGIFPKLIPKNIVSRCSSITQTGVVKGYEKENNQDSLLMIPQLNTVNYQFLFGVFDGHGKNGHLISNLIKNQIIETIPACPVTSDVYDLKNYLESTIQSVSGFVLSSNIDTDYSGSTLCMVLISGNHLICGNIGDSRCIIGKYDEI